MRVQSPGPTEGKEHQLHKGVSDLHKYATAPTITHTKCEMQIKIFVQASNRVASEEKGGTSQTQPGLHNSIRGKAGDKPDATRTQNIFTIHTAFCSSKACEKRGKLPPGRNALRSTGKLEQIMRHAPVQFRGEDNSYTRWPATGGGSRKTALKVRMTASNSTEVTAMGRAETVPVPLCKGLP